VTIHTFHSTFFPIESATYKLKMSHMEKRSWFLLFIIPRDAIFLAGVPQTEIPSFWQLG
jgi:hypothetical protein